MNKESIVFRGALLGLVTLAAFGLGYLTGGDIPEAITPLSPEKPAEKREQREPREESTVATGEARKQQLFSAFYQVGGYASRAHRATALAELVASLSLEELLLVADSLEDLPEHVREHAIRAVLGRIVELDPAAAARLVQGSTRLRPWEFLDQWAKKDPRSAVAWWKTIQLSGGFPNHVRISSILWQLGDTNPALAAEILVSEASSLDEHLFTDVFGKWAKADPEAAMAKAMKLGNLAQRRAAVSASVGGWAEKDPTGALAWFRQLTDPKLRSDVAAGIVLGLFKTDPEQSLSIAESLPEGPARDTTYAVLAHSLFFQSKREDFLRIAAKIPFDESNKEVAQLIHNWSFNDGKGFILHFLERLDSTALDPEERHSIEAYIEKDPEIVFYRNAESVAPLLSAGTAILPEETRQRWIQRAATEWGRRDLAPARAWAENLQAGPVRDAAFAGLAAGWAMNQFEDAAQWLETLPPSSTRNAAVGGFVRGVLNRDPAGALEWLRLLPNQTDQLKVLQEAWQRWRTMDPVSADKWRDTAVELSSTQRGALRDQANR